MEAARRDPDEAKVIRLEAFQALRAKLVAEAAAVPARRDAVATGMAALDAAAGGLRRGALSEFTGSAGNGSLVFAALLDLAGRERWGLALVDAADQFEPADWDAEALRRVLWVRCREMRPALRAVDLLLRDGNLPLLVLDLQGVPDAQLRRVPANVWHRFQRLVAPTGAALVVLSRWPIAEGARMRVDLPERWGLDRMRQRRRVMAADLRVRVREKAAMPVAEGERRIA
jgi:hypothetical protein